MFFGFLLILLVSVGEGHDLQTIRLSVQDQFEATNMTAVSDASAGSVLELPVLDLQTARRTAPRHWGEQAAYTQRCRCVEVILGGNKIVNALR
jgi:hypothetical protein